HNIHTYTTRRSSDLDALKQVQTDAEIEDVDEEKEQNPVKTISWKHLNVAGMTSGSAGFLMLGALVLFSQIQQFIPDSAYKQAVEDRKSTRLNSSHVS